MANGLMPMDFFTSASLNLRPMSRLIANRVLVGLVTAWRLAIWPTSRSPLSVKAMDGVVRLLLGVLGDLGVTAFHDGHARVGGAQVDSYDFSHDALLLS